MWEISDEEVQEEARCAQILEAVKEKVGAECYQAIIDYINESSYTYGYEIVEKAEGTRQEEDEFEFKYVYLDQYRNGGMTGDDYAGLVCIPITENEFLKFHYVH